MQDLKAIFQRYGLQSGHSSQEKYRWTLPPQWMMDFTLPVARKLGFIVPIKEIASSAREYSTTITYRKKKLLPCTSQLSYLYHVVSEQELGLGVKSTKLRMEGIQLNVGVHSRSFERVDGGIHTETFAGSQHPSTMCSPA